MGTTVNEKYKFLESAIIIDNCSDLMMHNFYKIGQTKDYRWLIRGWDGHKDIEAPEGLYAIWWEIFNEYCELVDDSDSQNFLMMKMEQDDCKLKYTICSMLIDRLIMGVNSKKEEDEYFAEISAHGFSFNKKNFLNELKRATAWLNSINMKVKMLQVEIEGYEKHQTKPQRLEAQQTKLERATKRDNIDPKTTSIAKWIELIKDAEIASRKNNRKRNKKAA